MSNRTATTRAMTAVLCFIAGCTAPTIAGQNPLPGQAFVRVSPRDPRYFELSDGRPYIPIGLNMISPPSDAGLDGMAEWLDKLSANGGNFIRVWLGHPFFDVEHARSGQYDEAKAERIDQLLQLCRARNIRAKLCIESFRHFGTRGQLWSAKPLHLIQNGGPARDIADFFDGQRSREQFTRKLAWYAKRYGSDPVVFGWELWNEINAVAGGDFMAWTQVMLPPLHRLFPKNLAMQSLGSFDTDGVREKYRQLAAMAGNDVAQVHRYLDLGARLEVCKGPMDVLADAAVRELLAVRPGRPVLLAESGAVEPSHSGPFKLYDSDKAGIILHDVVFAPFFSGAAGPGHCWHWDRYVDRNDLWWQFGRFAKAVEGIDPPAEGFEPLMLEHPRLRVYVLKGKFTVLVWCRDKQNAWTSELRDQKPPETISGAAIELGADVPLAKTGRIRAYDPWQDRWTDLNRKGEGIALPTFSRSLVLRIENGV